VNQFGLFLLVFFLTGCASFNTEEQTQFSNLLERGQYDQAIEFLEGSDLKQLPENKLLYQLEKGMTYYLNNQLKLAGQTFQAAKETIDRLYTTKVSQVLKAGVMNERVIDFYGEDFERSYLYFFSGMTHYKIYQQGMIGEKTLNRSQRRQYLFKARADMVAWDSFFKTLQRKNQLSRIYFNDLAAKVFAAKIHLLVGERSDQGIALRLFQDALEILRLIAPIYPEFNLKHQEYANNILGKIQDAKVPLRRMKAPGPFVPSEQYRALKNFLGGQLLSLAQKIRAGSVNGLKKRFGLDTVKATRLKKNEGLVSFILEKGFISAKTADRIDLSLKSAFDPNVSGARKILSIVGYTAFSAFAYNVLDMKSTYRRSNFHDSYQLAQLTRIAGTEAAIDFEIPMRRPNKVQLPLSIEVRNKNGERIRNLSPVLISSLDNIGYEATKESSAAYLARAGTRFVVKQAGAMIAAYTTYQTLRAKDSGDFLAKAAAMSTYLASSKLISLSEQADTRYWSGLPSRLYITELALPAGRYSVYLKGKNQGENFSTLLGEIKVKANTRDLFSYRVPQI
jgi:hypothetical protein